MNSTINSPSLPRGQKQIQILQAAKKLFLEHGFASTSVDAVVAASGVSKPTLYHHFPTKEALLEGVVQNESARHTAPVSIGATGNPQHDLEQAARLLLTLALAPESLAWDRMMAGEARRNPTLGNLFYEHGPQRVLQLLAGFFRNLGETSDLEIPNAEQAADFFFGLVVGVPLLRAQLGGESLSKHKAKTRCREAAERFLRAYSSPPTAKTRQRKAKGGRP